MTNPEDPKSPKTLVPIPLDMDGNNNTDADSRLSYEIKGKVNDAFVEDEDKESYDKVSKVPTNRNPVHSFPSVTKNDDLKGQVVIIKVDENDKHISKVDTKTSLKRYLGLILAIFSGLMFSINSLICKLLDYQPPLIPVSYMFISTTLFTIPLYLYHHCIQDNENKTKKHTSFGSLEWKKCLILLLRSFTGCSGMIFFFYALNYLNIGDALVIACSSPVFVFIIAFLFLGESCGIVPVFTVISALLGVVIITRPPLLTGEDDFDQQDLIGAALAFCSMLCIASTLILMRFLQDVHHSLINLVFGGWGTLQTLGIAAALGVLELPNTVQDAVIMATTGLVFFFAQTFLALALQLEDAGPVSLLRTSEVIFAFLWQLVFLNLIPDLYSITGTLLIMAGIVTTILRKWIGSLPPGHKVKQRLGCLLI